VHPDGHVQVDDAFYSVPYILVGEEVKVQWDENLVRVYARGRSVAVHSRKPTGAFATRPEHRPVHKPAREEAYVAGLLSRAELIGPNALQWAKMACDERGVRAYRLIQGMLSLARNFPRERIEWACRLTLEKRLFRYKILRRLLEREKAGTISPLIQSHEIIRELSEYAEEVKL